MENEVLPEQSKIDFNIYCLPEKQQEFLRRKFAEIKSKIKNEEFLKDLRGGERSGD